MPSTAVAPQETTAGLADELQALYLQTRSKMGEADLAHIRTVTAYGQAINARRLELLRDGGPKATSRAMVLEMLYRLLQFSELGHNILHGSYDDLPGNGQYHSDRYHWDFNVDPTQWKVMHHEGHHPEHQHRRQRPRSRLQRPARPGCPGLVRASRGPSAPCRRSGPVLHPVGPVPHRQPHQTG
jgi:hypothetical protein